MATIYRNSASTDFDDLFDLNQSGQYAANVNMRTSDGTDLSRRYEVVSYGAKRADVNYRNSAGTDVTNFWAAKGTAVYALPFNGYSYSASNGAPTGSTGTTSASRSISINADGTWTIGGSGSLSSGGATSGTWLPSGSAVSQWQVMFAGTPSWSDGASYGASSNGASAYAAATTTRIYQLSASVNSASAQSASGTVTVTVYLKNTSTGQVITSQLKLSVSVVGWK